MILSVLFPRHCLRCKKGSRYLCSSCLSLVPCIGFHSFRQYSLWRYRGLVRQAILSLKYKFAFDLVPDFAFYICLFLRSSHFPDRQYYLIPIPSSIQRTRWRGFNPTELIAKEIATTMHWIYFPCLIKRFHTQSQVGLSQSERIKNVSGSFSLRKGITLNPLFSYILFDDVYTSGATLREASTLLRSAGITNFLTLTLAKD